MLVVVSDGDRARQQLLRVRTRKERALGTTWIESKKSKEEVTEFIRVLLRHVTIILLREVKYKLRGVNFIFAWIEFFLWK